MPRGRTPEALSEIESDGLFRGLAGSRVLVAVSGGADSTALLWLLKRWDGAAALFAATVDHGLRPGSAEEAAHVADFAHGLAVPHATLVWEGDKPATGIEAAARAARYDLLERHAAAIGATHVVTAHTLDDQAETVLMRLAAGSGPAGLAGMRAIIKRGALVHARPLLGVAKARLVATLVAAEVGWSEDPMNADAAFARARLRGAHAVLAREGLTSDRLAVLAGRMARVEEALQVMADEAWVRHATVEQGRLSLAAEVFTFPEEIVVRLMRRAVTTLASGPEAAIRLERLETLALDMSEALRDGRKLVRTLAGQRVEAGRNGIVVTPAPPRRHDSRS